MQYNESRNLQSYMIVKKSELDVLRPNRPQLTLIKGTAGQHQSAPLAAPIQMKLNKDGSITVHLEFTNEAWELLTREGLEGSYCQTISSPLKQKDSTAFDWSASDAQTVWEKITEYVCRTVCAPQIHLHVLPPGHTGHAEDVERALLPVVNENGISHKSYGFRINLKL